MRLLQHLAPAIFIGRNASTTQSAKFLVVFLKKEGAPVLTP